MPPPLNVTQLHSLVDRIEKATKSKDVAGVLGYWMAGTPSKSLQGLFDQLAQSQAGASWWQKIPGTSVVIPGIAGAKAFGAAVGLLVYGGKLYYIEDAYPNGPSPQDAMATLFLADPGLSQEVLAAGTGQRAFIAAQVNKVASQSLPKPLQLLNPDNYIGADAPIVGPMLEPLIDVLKWGVGLTVAVAAFRALR